MSRALRERALRLLARREHSRVELGQKLAAHAESEEEIPALLDALCERGLLSDERYVEARLNTRLPRFGNARLAYELRMKGVSEEIVDSALADKSELPRAYEVWQRRFGTLPPRQNAVERARQSRFLMNRGFSGETIRRVLRGDFEDE